MYSREKYIIICSVFLLALLLISSMGCIGDPNVKYVIENQTGDELTVFLKDFKSNDIEIGKVQPGKQIIDYRYIGTTELHYLAKNKAGKIVFDKILTFEQMEEISSLEYKIVIKAQ